MNGPSGLHLFRLLGRSLITPSILATAVAALDTSFPNDKTPMQTTTTASNDTTDRAPRILLNPKGQRKALCSYGTRRGGIANDGCGSHNVSPKRNEVV